MSVFKRFLEKIFEKILKNVKIWARHISIHHYTLPKCIPICHSIYVSMCRSQLENSKLSICIYTLFLYTLAYTLILCVLLTTVQADIRQTLLPARPSFLLSFLRTLRERPSTRLTTQFFSNISYKYNLYVYSYTL